MDTWLATAEETGGPPPQLETLVRIEGNTIVYQLRGDLDMGTVEELRRLVMIGFAAGGAAMVFDCSDLHFLDSCGLNLLMQTDRLAAKEGSSLVLRNPRPAALRLLEMTGLDRELEVDRTPC